MNTNVGDMPLDIFCDYVSDILGEEWSWEYFGLILNWHDQLKNNYGNGMRMYELGCGYNNEADSFGYERHEGFGFGNVADLLTFGNSIRDSEGHGHAQY
jgi:hypothetical protein